MNIVYNDCCGMTWYILLMDLFDYENLVFVSIVVRIYVGIKSNDFGL